MRAKWSAPIRKYWKISEQMMVKYCDLAICDSVNIEKYIHECYDGKGIKGRNPKTTFIAYGADLTLSKLADDDEKLMNWYREKGLTKKDYYLVVGRFVPENSFEVMIREFMKSKSKKNFAIITNVNEKFLNKKNFESKYADYFVDNVDYSGSTSLINKLKMGINIIYSQEAKRKFEELVIKTKPEILSALEKEKMQAVHSLHTQILQIHNYIRENPELMLTDTYADNGFTGTRFDRPEFERMMQDIRTGKIQCIVVKDLSRFGRDYIETGSYLETIFPMLHVRFIAINDDFDNIRQSDVDSLAVPIKNMVNSLYAKDISKKISLSYQMRREKGIPTSWCTPYGYQLNQQGNKLEATEDAKWVKLIYQWYLAGVSTNEIARRLEFLEVARPNERLNRKLHEGDDPTYNKWHPSTVLRILNSSAYIGELVSGKTQTASYKGIGLHPVEKKEWHIVENAHEAIILKSDFEKVQARREQNKEKRERAMARSKATREKCYNHLSGMVYCGCCRRNMTFERRVHGTVKETHYGVFIEDLEKQAEAIRVEQIKLYESYADGVLRRDAYIEKKKILSKKLVALQDSIRTEKEEQECADELDEEIRALTKQASEKTYIGGLTKECVDAFVSMVYLYDDQTMKIEFNCEDVIRRALEKYGT